VTSEDGGIRIRGGVSRGTIPRGMNFYAREEAGEIDTFNAFLFGNDYKPSAVSLDAGGNQLITAFNDYMMTQRVRNLNMATRLFEPYMLFLDGEYWGFYWITEKYDETYFAHYYDVNPNNCVMIKNDQVEIGCKRNIKHRPKLLFLSGKTAKGKGLCNLNRAGCKDLFELHGFQRSP